MSDDRLKIGTHVYIEGEWLQLCDIEGCDRTAERDVRADVGSGVVTTPFGDLAYRHRWYSQVCADHSQHPSGRGIETSSGPPEDINAFLCDLFGGSTAHRLGELA